MEIPEVVLPPFLPIGLDEALVEENVEDRLREVSNKAFKAYLRTRDIGSYHIETYEEAIQTILEKVRGIEIPMDMEGKLRIGFTDVYLEKPTVTPLECRTRSLHYTGKLKARSVLIDVERNKRFESKDLVSLCDLPILVRSRFCVLFDLYKEYDQANDALMAFRQVSSMGKDALKKTYGNSYEFQYGETEVRFKEAAQRLQEAGADPADPGKYFIMDGVPRIILLTEKLRLNIPYVYMETGRTVLSLSMWSPRPITSILRIVGENVTNKNDAENLYMNIFFQNSIFEPTHGTTGQLNIFYLFRILGISNKEDMVRIIRRIYPTYDDPKRAAVLETLITICAKSMTDCYDHPEFADNEDKFFEFVYNKSFKKHIIRMYPMKQVADTLSNIETLQAAAMDEGIAEEDLDQPIDNDDIPASAAGMVGNFEPSPAQIKAWCQQVICLNTMSHLQLSGEKQSGNINWFDPSDEQFINVYHPRYTREIHARVYNFTSLLVKYCLTRIGELQPANRDSWENKRLLTTGERFVTQFHHSFFRAVQWDKTAKKISNTVSETARNYWDNLPDELREKVRTGVIPIDVILSQIKIKTSFTWSNSLIREDMTEEEKKEAEKLMFEKMDRKNQVCDLVCQHDSDIIVPLVLEDFWNAFKKRSWGIRGMDSYWEKDVTDTLNVNQSDLHTYNQLCQIVVRTNEQSKNIQPRLVQESQMYFVCPVVTPEGPNVGKTKQVAVGTVVSAAHLRPEDLKKFMEVLNLENFDGNPSGFPDSVPKLYRRWVDPRNGQDLSGLCRLFYNGCFIGLCEGKEMRDYLTNLRGMQVLFKDCCIAFDEMYQLHVTTEGSRLMRPVFRLNKETGNPMFLEDLERGYLVKPYLMARDWQEMERLGYIEYIDAWEQMSGFYMTQAGKPFFIRSIDDVPMEERRVENIYKPFPTGFLIANSIWDIYQTREKSRYALNKLKAIKGMLKMIKGGSTEIITQVIAPSKRSMITFAFGAMMSTTDAQLQMADQYLMEAGQYMLNNMGLNPDEKIGQGKVFRSVYRDTIKALSLSKTDFQRESNNEVIKNTILEYLETEIQGLEKMIADLSIRGRYTHATISPAMLYSAVALDIPYLSHIHGPRANLASKFNQQAIRGPHMNHDVLMPGEVKVLERPEIPLVVTSTSGFTGLAHHPAGQNVIVAVACFEGENQEDSLIFNRRSLEQGMFKYNRYYTETLSKDSDETGIFGSEMYHRGVSKKGDLVFGKHEVIHKNDARYRHISRRGGLPKPGIFLNPRDCIIAAYEGDIDRSIYVKEDGAGFVDRVTVTRNFAGNPVVKVRVKQVLEPIVGDKFASRHAQKCTIGRIADPEDMPFVEGSGLRPDIIMNPHSLPSRQTVGQVLEMVAAKAALLKGERVVADVFEKPNIQNMVEVLKQYGYDQSGQEVLIDPKTGERFSSKVLIGPCYYQALKHQVKYKIQSREGYGAIDTITGQPVGGRQVKGGTREGTMETAILNMSDSMALHQCMVSDPYPVRVCKACGSYVTPLKTTTEGVCEAVSCVYCHNVSNTRFNTLQTMLEAEAPENIPAKLVELLLNNFTNPSLVGDIVGVVPLIENFKIYLTSFLESSSGLFIGEAIRRGLFPNALSDYVGETDLEIHENVVSMGERIQTFWTTLLDKVTSFNKNLYRETVKINSIRPILKVDWQTTIIPQSSMVFFRYINQMGYRTKFKFTPTAQNMVKMVSNENEQKILRMVNTYVEENGPIDTIRSSDIIAHVQTAYPDINISRGTPVWNLISGYVQQLKPANI
jgi:DNA-directed RNA polymerase beta subunit